jgi:type VI protein secretion system component VasK
MSDDIMGLAAMLAVLVGGAALLIVLIWQIGATWRARSLAAREDAYRTLAERATATQEKLVAELAEVRQRVQEIERMLKDVG